MNNEREVFKLPVKQESEDKRFENFQALVCKALKSQLHNIINNRPLTFDNEIAQAVKFIWEDGYNESLKQWNSKFGTTASETSQEKSMDLQPTQTALLRKQPIGIGLEKTSKK